MHTQSLVLASDIRRDKSPDADHHTHDSHNPKFDSVKDLKIIR